MPGLPGVQPEAHAHPVHGEGIALARLQVEKNRIQENDLYPFMPFSPHASLVPALQTVEPCHFVGLSDRLLAEYIPHIILLGIINHP